jgi:hypothetical protein
LVRWIALIAIDGIDDGALVDEHVIHLDDAGRSAGRRWRLENADGLGLIRIGNVVGAKAAVEEGAEHDLVGLPSRRPRHILMDVVGAEFTGLGVDRVVGHRAGRDRDQIGLIAKAARTRRRA